MNESLNPVWNQTFDFVVEDGLHDMLIVEVWDHDTFGKVKSPTFVQMLHLLVTTILPGSRPGLCDAEVAILNHTDVIVVYSHINYGFDNHDHDHQYYYGFNYYQALCGYHLGFSFGLWFRFA